MDARPGTITDAQIVLVEDVFRRRGKRIHARLRSWSEQEAQAFIDANPTIILGVIKPDGTTVRFDAHGAS